MRASGSRLAPSLDRLLRCKVITRRDVAAVLPSGSLSPSRQWYIPALRAYTPRIQLHESSSSSRWTNRQGRDVYAREAKVAGLKSRAAFKLLEINDKHRLFRPGDTVVDLGFAPGSWSQVAVNRTQPRGRVVGIDVIPAQPPRGVSTLQGDFLSPRIREEVRAFVRDPMRGRTRGGFGTLDVEGTGPGLAVEDLEEEGKSLLEKDRGNDALAALDEGVAELGIDDKETLSTRELDIRAGRVVDVVLSDMMMNTSGVGFRDHAGSMDLCFAALTFCYDTLVTDGHFLCKFYQGAEDHAFELRLKRLFTKVHRIKPDSSRKESREAYFLCLRRKAGVDRKAVLDEG